MLCTFVVVVFICFCLNSLLITRLAGKTSSSSFLKTVLLVIFLFNTVISDELLTIFFFFYKTYFKHVILKSLFFISV